MIRSSVDRLKNYAQEHAWVFPLVLLFEAFISFGIMGMFSGFYWDDWPPVLLSHIAKANIFWISYADRPFSSWTYTLMFPVLGNSAPAWQMATLLLRWAGVYLGFLVLVTLMPKQRALLHWAALISIVLPVFQYQYISVAFSQHFLTYAIFAGSLYLLVMSIKHPRHFWLFYPLSILLAVAHIFMMEYFVGLEVLRPFVAYVSLKKFSAHESKMFRKTLLLYLPFFAVLLAYVYWRFFIYPQAFHISANFSNTPLLVYQFLAHPLSAVKDLLTSIIADLRFSFFSSWLDRLWPADLYLESKFLWFTLFLGILACGVFLLFFGERKENSSAIANKEFWINFVLGLAIFLFGIAPVWVTLRQVSEGKFSERFALAALAGIALIVVTIIWRVIQSVRIRNTMLSILVILSVSYQIQTGSDFNKEYNQQQGIYSQLKWRMPELKPGTAIYSPGIFSEYEADYSYSMGINILYDNAIQTDLKYWFFTPRDYLAKDLLNDPTLALKGGIKSTKFAGSASDMIAVYENGSGCLLVLDPIYSQLSTVVENFTAYGSITNFSQIVDTGLAKMVFPQAFGKISTNNWCYYFEQADLAKQEKEWDKVIALYDQATQKGEKPIKSVEYIPLITALAEKGQISQAFDVTRQAIAMSDSVIPSACKLWDTLAQQNPKISSTQVSAVLGDKACTP